MTRRLGYLTFIRPPYGHVMISVLGFYPIFDHEFLDGKLFQGNFSKFSSHTWMYEDSHHANFLTIFSWKISILQGVLVFLDVHNCLCNLCLRIQSENFKIFEKIVENF